MQTNSKKEQLLMGMLMEGSRSGPGPAEYHRVKVLEAHTGRERWS